jgi:hypothetical protein
MWNTGYRFSPRPKTRGARKFAITAPVTQAIKRKAAVCALHCERTVSTPLWQHVVVFRRRG